MPGFNEEFADLAVARAKVFQRRRSYPFHLRWRATKSKT
jgi:hypothetical protein